MDKKQKLILVTILCLLMIIAIILVILLQLKSTHSDNNNYIESNNVDNSIIEEIFEETTNIEYNYSPIENTTRYFTVKKCVENYKKAVELKDYNAVYNMLNKSYITKNSVNKNNISNYIESYSENEKIIIKKMYELGGNSVEQYSVEYYIVDTQNFSYRKLYLICTLDTLSSTFSIIPKIENVSSIENIKLEKDDSKIEKNSDNNFEYQRLSEAAIARAYYYAYNDMMLYLPKEAYKYLDANYKEIKFNNSYEEFIRYINRNKEKLETSVITTYSIEEKEYLLTNNLQDTYILKEKNIMDFTICLDNYTLKPTEFNSYTDESKANYYSRMVISMINHKEYEKLYDLINSTFKKNNFNTVTKFMNYISNNFYDNNYIINSNIKQENQYYIVNMDLQDRISSAANQKNINIIIKINENNFELSFSV